MPAYASGATGIITGIFAQDTRVSGVAGLTTLTYATTGLTFTYYRFNDGSVVTHAPVSMTLGTHIDWGFAPVSASAQPGGYAIGLPDAFFANPFVGGMVFLFGADHMAVVPLRIDVVAAADFTATHAIPGQVLPPTTVSLQDAILYNYKFATQPKEQDQVSLRIYDPTHTTVQQKQPVVQFDETLVSFDRMVSGP